MEKTTFEINIQTPKNKVWDVLWSDNSYQQWTSIFSEGSKAETDWKEGSKVLFLDGKGRGMVSKIDKRIDNEFMSFKHLGIVKEDGVEDLTSPEVKKWAGAHENYTLKEANGTTTLKVDLDVDQEHSSYFLDTFPKALQIVKNLSENPTFITVTAVIQSPIEKVWKYWTAPEHITKWNQASDDWHSPRAENDVRKGGKFSITMAAKDGSASFDFAGVYTEVKAHEKISYEMGDGRKVDIIFTQQADNILLTETFEAENTFSAELQREGWQAILDNFKKYVEQH